MSQNESPARSLLSSKFQFMLRFLLRYVVIVFLLLGTFLSDGFAQKFQDAEFGEIPDSLFTLSAPADFPDAKYMITNKEIDVSFTEEDGSIVAILDHHVRLKIFDQSAREASIISIPYYFDNDMEQISDIRGWTHWSSGQQEALQQGDIRTVNINSRYNVKEFTMPSVIDGAVLEYRYTIKRRYIEELPDFFLSHRVPTAAAKLTITYPKYLRYKKFTENYSSDLQNDFVYTDTSSVPKIFTIPQPPPVVTERWMAYDIAPTKEEPFITSLNDHRARLKFLMNQFGNPRQTLDISWEVVVAKLRRKTNPLEVIRKNETAQAKGDSIGQALSNASPKMVQDSIFRYLNRRVNFSGAHSPYSTTNDEQVLEGDPADQAAINQTLTAMLWGAGIEAHPVLSSTRESGTIDKNFPSFYQFNAQMVRTRINGESYLLDASFPHSQPGLIPVEMYNDQGLELRPKSFSWFDIAPAQSSFDIDVDLDAELASDGDLSGTISSRQRGYPVQQMRQQRADGMPDSEIISRALFDGYTNLQLDSVQIRNLDDYENPVEISAHFSIENYATSFTDGLEFRPMIVGYRMENPFEDENRTLPVTLDAPEQLDVSYTIDLPSGFSIEAGKQNRLMELPGAEFRERYDIQSGTLNYEYNINIAQKEFSTDLFPQLYNLYNRWVELSNATWLIES